MRELSVQSRWCRRRICAKFFGPPCICRKIWYAALYGECRAGAEIIFPQSGRGLGHVTPKIFGIRSNMSLLCGSTVGYPSDSLASCSVGEGSGSKASKMYQVLTCLHCFLQAYLCILERVTRFFVHQIRPCRAKNTDHSNTDALRRMTYSLTNIFRSLKLFETIKHVLSFPSYSQISVISSVRPTFKIPTETISD